MVERRHMAGNWFITEMSHDLRTLLHAIQGDCLLVEKHAGDRDKVKSYSKRIYASGQQLLELINDMLDMGCIESEMTKLKTCEFNWISAMKEIHTTFKSQAEAKELALCFYINNPDEIEWIAGDRQYLCRILRNILSNAIKYTAGNGTVDVTVTMTKENEHKAEMTCQIKDNGCGMSKEFLGVLFEPFERENSERNTGIMGTGLGMFIVRGFTELMNGELAVESEEGKGTMVTVRLPFEIVPERETQSDGETDVENALEGMHFLVAEDNESNAEILYEILKLMGSECTITKHGQEVVAAFEQSESGDYDAILMDIQMPVMDGYMAASTIRNSRHPDAESIKIIAMTADSYEEDIYRALAAGMDAHISKPVDLKEFINTVSASYEKPGI